MQWSNMKTVNTLHFIFLIHFSYEMLDKFMIHKETKKENAGNTKAKAVKEDNRA